MARSKRYTKKLLALDIVLAFLTGGAWLIVVVLRELYRRQ